MFIGRTPGNFRPGAINAAITQNPAVYRSEAGEVREATMTRVRCPCGTGCDDSNSHSSFSGQSRPSLTSADQSTLADSLDGPMESLRAKGMRRTSRRREIWEFFARSPRGLTPGEAARELKASGVGQATVYRTVKALTEMGYLRVVGGGEENEKRYVASRPGHVHLLTCRGCGRAEEVRDCNLATLEKLLAVQTGFTVEGHRLEFFGLCPACRSAASNVSSES